MLLFLEDLPARTTAFPHLHSEMMGLNYYASSPTVVLPPQQPSSHWRQHHPHDEIAMGDSCAMEVQHPPSPKRMKYPTPPSMNYIANSSSTAGRKRSRADIGDEHDEEHAASVTIEPSKPKAEPIMGPGMTLIYPDDPQLNIAAESQSGTWMEEKADATPSPVHPERPRIIARKSMRLNENDPTSNSASQTLEIDPVILKLGIGWKRVSEHQAAAVAGEETYIRKQYSFREPNILLQHEGLGIYIVRTKPDDAHSCWDNWWLFKDDLKSCRFLCNDEAELFRRLSNKVQDERGNWFPDILVVGPVVHAKDVSDSLQQVEAVSPTTQPVEDVTMME
jgi:hypothetical protein